jgi:hypothetical protein
MLLRTPMETAALIMYSDRCHLTDVYLCLYHMTFISYTEKYICWQYNTSITSKKVKKKKVKLSLLTGHGGP